MEKRKKKMISKEEKEGKGKKIKQKKQNSGCGFITNSEEKRIKSVEPKKEIETHNISDSSHHHEEKPQTDFIHVRARRGQATDNHSLAARREKMRERFQLLESLVPVCDKINGKAQVLDEIIKYVQSLQNLAECLAAKLASVNSTIIGFEVDQLMNTQAPDETPSLNGQCYFEFPQFCSFADTSTTTTPAFAFTETFQDDGDLFSGLNVQSQNIDIRFSG